MFFLQYQYLDISTLCDEIAVAVVFEGDSVQVTSIIYTWETINVQHVNFFLLISRKIDRTMALIGQI